MGVTDGDTINVLRAWRSVKVRLYGVDCPEKGQPFGGKAKRFTSALVFGHTVRVEPAGDKVDRYGRVLAYVYDENGLCVNRELVSVGLAWWFKRYAPEETTLEQREAQAKLHRRGLFSDPHAVPPWEWRSATR